MTTVALPVLLALPDGTVCIPALISLVGMGAGFAFMTPPGMTAVNGVAAATGWTNAKSMFLWGGVLMLLSILVMVFLGYPLGSLFM